MIPFSRRELIKAWNCARQTSTIAHRNDSHRLLLFYSVECGLKAVLLRQKNLDIVDERIGQQYLHDVNSLLTALKIGGAYFLPFNLSLQPLRQRDRTDLPRNVAIGALNQIWRYGGSLTAAENELLENKLDMINVWIAKEIQ